MTNSKIFAIATLTGILLVTVMAQNALAGGGISAEDDWETPLTAKAVPGWVDNNFKWYGEGKIGQSDLLNSLSYMLDNGFMHLSDKAAQEVQDLKNENEKLRMEQAELLSDVFNRSDEPLATTDDQGRIKSQFNWDAETEESLNHLRKAYDLNPNLETKVVQFDKDHDKWIDVLSIDWGSSSSTQGDPDRPVIVGRIYNTETTDDRPTEEVAFYYNKISFAQDTINDIMAKGGTTSAWKDGIDKLSSSHGDSTVDSVVDDLQGIVVLCSTAIDNEILKIQAEMSVLEEILDRQPAELTVRAGSTVQYGESDMEFLQRHAERVGEKILSLQTGLDVLEQELATIGEDAQLANIDLQNTLQKQQQSIDSLIDKTSTMHVDGEFWFTDLKPGS